MDGSFLVRISKRNPGQHVLTMACDKTVFNYEIKSKIVDVSNDVYSHCAIVYLLCGVFIRCTYFCSVKLSL